MAAKKFGVAHRFNGRVLYVSSTRPLNGGWVGANWTDKKSRAKRLGRAEAKVLATRLNKQDGCLWNDRVAVDMTKNHEVGPEVV